MKTLALLFLFVATLAQAGEISLPTPHTVNLTPPVTLFRCGAWTATVSAYKTIATGFSADGNYVLGQVQGTFVCGSSGRGGGLYYYKVCVQFQWDLTGTLVNTTATPGRGSNGYPISVYCPTADPTETYTNSGGYVAETIITQACGSVACYATYYTPTLVTP
jgi:hypothetical protein